MQRVSSWAAIWPPLTLATLAALARRHGEVALADGNVEPRFDLAAATARVSEFKPDVVVINTSFPSIDSDAACAQALKDACPDAVVVGCGQFFTLLREEAMVACPAVDVALRGEPEAAFDALLSGDPRRPEGVAGLMWRDLAAVVVEPDRPMIDDLDALPMPARDLLRNHSYRLPDNGRPFTLVNTARGCPHACTYCITAKYHGRKIRRHSPGYILEEMRLCHDQYGIRDILFWEEVFTMDRDFALAQCEAIARDSRPFRWASTTRADRMDLELAKAMKGAGCFLMGLGIETASQDILDRAHKGESLDDMRRAVDFCKQAGLRTMGHFIFGLPGETPETAQVTVDFALKLGLDYLQCYAAVPYPGTALGELAREKGWLRSARWADYDFGGPSIMDLDTIAHGEVDQYREMLFRRFYFRPTYLARRGLELLAHPRQFIQAAAFLDWIKTG